MVPLVRAFLRGSLTLVFLLLAGCTGGNDQKPKESPTLSSDSPYGQIEGIVSDDELRAIEGAEVGLRGTAWLTRTNAEGHFLLDSVEPGTYTIDAARIGFLPGVRQVTVKAGEVTPADFTLKPVEVVADTYYEVFPFVGWYDCALGAVVWVSPCSYPYTAVYLSALGAGVNLSDYGLPPDIQKSDFRYNFTVGPNATDIVSEMVWSANTGASTKMQMILSCANYDPILDDCTDADSYASVEGESPLRVPWQASKVPDKPAWVMSRGYLPFLDPQVAFSQRFDMWNTVFYNGPAPKDFSIFANNPV